jgi:hypothetical protein
MPSSQIEAVKTLHRSWGTTLAANSEMPLDEWRDMVEGWAVLRAEPGDVDYVESDSSAVPELDAGFVLEEGGTI